MKNISSIILVSAALASYICSTSSLGLGNIFGSRKDVLAEAEEGIGGSIKDGEHHTHGEHHPHEDHHTHTTKPPHHPTKPTHPPLLPAIPHPADTPLNPENNPHHPLNHLPHGQKETIVATKTVFVEMTSKVTHHPICMTAYGVKPPCLPVQEYHKPAYHPYRPHQHQREDSEDIHSFIQPTASVQSLEPTRILSGVSLSKPAPVEELNIEPSHEDGNSRSGRYIEVATHTPVAPVKTESDIADKPEDPSIRLVEGIFNRHPVTEYTTKTLWVTKIEKYVDHRVTATLEVKNCIPAELDYPLCPAETVHHVPGYPPYKPVSYLESHAGKHEAIQETNKGKESEKNIPNTE